MTARPDFLLDTSVTLGECRPELDSNQTIFKVNRKKTDGWDYPCGFESYEMKRFISRHVTCKSRDTIHQL